MMRFLIFNITDDPIQMRMRIGKRCKPRLPFKSPNNPLLLVDEFRRICLDISHQIGYSGVWRYSDQDMDMIGHRINPNHGLVFVGYNSGNILV